MEQQTLVSISEASHILGVSEVALRQWTDEGKIKAFITPGGHRRYSRAELKKFMNSPHKKLSLRDIASGLEDTVPLLREISRTSLHSTSWCNKVDAQSQERLAYLGRELLNITIRYITEPSKREEITKLIRGIGRDHGEILAKLGFPLTDSVEAFIRHRDPMINAITRLRRKREAYTDRVVGAIPLVAHVLDEALVSLVAAHQWYRNGVRTTLKEEAAG